ncbi:MAG: glutathione S-transferase N-terminal domain-containing protein [Marivibrio sp.]|uniref:glutathione S-transferase family protein n=1 Tax=Marivibrio sp. TaxID=2039719 RepID=UPI0032ED9302
MKLYYSPTSPYVRKVMVCAIERGLKDRIQLEKTDGFGESHRAANPLAKVPALEPDEGAPALFDSLVICDHLDRIGDAPRLIPDGAKDGGKARDGTLRRHAIGQGMTDAALLMQVQRVRNQRLEHPIPDDWWMERQREAIRASVDRMELEIDELSAAFELGAISVATALGYLDFRFPDFGWRDQAPHLAEWFKQIAERPSMAETAPPES